MDDEEKKLTAYHEAGHALVQGVLDDGHMPVHKVTIIPRGRSLGSTMFIPKKDVLTQAMKRMLNQIAMGLGGRIAEELVIGDISSGAAGDIKQITAIARHMVCDWGMSPLGPDRLRRQPRHRFPGPRHHAHRECLRGDRPQDRRRDPADHLRAVRAGEEDHRRAPLGPGQDRRGAPRARDARGQARPRNPRVRGDPLPDRDGLRRQAGRKPEEKKPADKQASTEDLAAGGPGRPDPGVSGPGGAPRAGFTAWICGVGGLPQHGRLTP
jgi:hypothetical protein